MKIEIKPLTVNQCWQGKRFKTPKYKAFEAELLLKLTSINRVPEGDLSLHIDAGLSNKLSDIDNIAKPFIDVLQKKYGFNDNRIYQLTLIKTIVKKGEEYLDFWFEPFV